MLPGLTLALMGALPSLTKGTFPPSELWETFSLGAPSAPAFMVPRGPSRLWVVFVSVDSDPCDAAVAALEEVGVDWLTTLGVTVRFVLVQDMGVASRALTCSNWFFRFVKEARRSSRRVLSAFSWWRLDISEATAKKRIRKRHKTTLPPTTFVVYMSAPSQHWNLTLFSLPGPDWVVREL